LGLLNGAWFVDTGSSQAPRRVSNLIAGGAPDQLAAFTIAAIGAELPGSLIIVGLFYPPNSDLFGRKDSRCCVPDYGSPLNRSRLPVLQDVAVDRRYP